MSVLKNVPVCPRRYAASISRHGRAYAHVLRKRRTEPTYCGRWRSERGTFLSDRCNSVQPGARRMRIGGGDRSEKISRVSIADRESRAHAYARNSSLIAYRNIYDSTRLRFRIFRISSFHGKYCFTNRFAFGAPPEIGGQECRKWLYTRRTRNIQGHF